jgi:hypothetical protein
MTIFNLLLLCLLVPGSLAWAQTPTEGRWTSLFDGKDLAGWYAYGAEKWVVEDGTILGESTVGKYGYLATEKTYGDFVLRARFKCETDGNSGLFIRSRITGESPATGPDIEGMQVEVDRTRHTGGLYESAGRGWVALPSPVGERAIRPDDWNELEVAAEGRHIVTRLNGVQVVDFSDPAPRFTNGVIALQLHTGGGVKVRCKDIFIQELSK